MKAMFAWNEFQGAMFATQYLKMNFERYNGFTSRLFLLPPGSFNLDLLMSTSKKSSAVLFLTFKPANLQTCQRFWVIKARDAPEGRGASL